MPTLDTGHILPYTLFIKAKGHSNCHLPKGDGEVLVPDSEKGLWRGEGENRVLTSSRHLEALQEWEDQVKTSQENARAGQML